MEPICFFKTIGVSLEFWYTEIDMIMSVFVGIELIQSTSVVKANHACKIRTMVCSSVQKFSFFLEAEGSPSK
jgi:hypothetical protein